MYQFQSSIKTRIMAVDGPRRPHAALEKLANPRTPHTVLRRLLAVAFVAAAIVAGTAWWREAGWGSGAAGEDRRCRR